jgi:ubiquinone/menaquinone biosynthesis C-methylase UbiE
MKIITTLLQALRRKLNPANPEQFEPVSKVFGIDRGTPVDRYYIEKFLEQNKQYIKGKVLEIAESTYSRKYGTDITSFEVLHASNDNPKATITGDLTKIETLPGNSIDCFICTQTFNFIYNFQDAIKGAYHLLKPGGVLLATVAGITQISGYDMQRWGDYWRFTTASAKKAFEESFNPGDITIEYYGSYYAASNFLKGLCTEELKKEYLDKKAADYPVIITIVAKKKQVRTI